MNMIINNSSMVPIYEQIVDQIKASIVARELLPGDPLPSVRALAREQKISALTVKKAYDILEEKGIIYSLSTKGCFISDNTIIIKAFFIFVLPQNIINKFFVPIIISSEIRIFKQIFIFIQKNRFYKKEIKVISVMDKEIHF